MIDMTHEDIERIWNSLIHYIPERSKLEEAINTVYDEQEEEDNNVDIERYEDH